MPPILLWLAFAGAPDFRTFVARVEPIFVKPREGSARCYDCHSRESNKAAFHLAPLGPDGKWSTAQSRANYENVLRLITPGEPLKSRLLTHPLAADAGGDEFHTGGKFWASQEDPEWKLLSDWVRGRPSK
ncbi:MAG TPA: hypothetical protein VFA33_28650 [Bryobacteraceae bacterium]|nr:hypothetical protein [Bryobacteraceae bacterium]